MNDLAYFSHAMVSFAATYLLHSTVLLAVCWMVIRGSRTTSHFLVERMWKLAAVLGLVTAVLQIGTGASPVMELTLFASSDPSSRRAVVELPIELPGTTTQETSVLVTGSPRSAGSLATVSDSLESRGEFEPTMDYEETPRFHPTKNEAIAEALIGATDLSAASSEPKHEFPIDRPAEPRPLVRPAPIVAQPNRLLEVLPIVVRAVSVTLTMSIAAGALLLAWQSLRLRSRFCGASVVRDGPARHALDRFLRRNRIRRPVRLLESSRHAEPIAYGLFRWTIVLPENTDERLGPEELKALLAHEVAHLVRGDVRWLWIGQVLCTCLAFQPLNFVARRRWQRAAEYLCDDWAVERGIRSLSLARCLTQIAEWRFGTQPCAVGLAAGGSKATMVQRVERLIEGRKQTDGWTKPRRRTLVNLAAMLCIPMLVGFAPRVSLPPATEVPGHGCDEIQESSDSDTPRRPLPGQEWRALQEELLQLEADLDRANHLLEGTPRHPRAEPLMNDIRQRAALLRARRERITLSFGRESER